MSSSTDIARLLREHGGRRDVYLLAGDLRLGYGRVLELAEANAERLRRRGVSRRPVALPLERSPEAVVAYWSLLLADAVVLVLDPRAPESERRRLCALADCRWLLEPGPATPASEVPPRDSSDASLRLCPIEPDRKPGATPANEPADLEGVAVLAPTSGTRGRPKLVRWTHRGLLANCRAHGQALGLSGRDRALVAHGLHYSFAHTAQLLAHTLLGGSLVLEGPPLFSPRAFCRSIERHGVTVSSLVPAMIAMLDAYRGLERHDLSSLRLITFGGAPSPPGALRSLVERLPDVRLAHTYGLTEAGPRVCTLLPDELERLPSVGRPLPGVEVGIFDHRDDLAPAGVTGEVGVRGPSVTPGCLGASPAEPPADGWLRTGDLGRLDDDGYLEIVGRLGDGILSGGVLVDPREVEAVLCRHPGIERVLVRAEPHEVLGQIAIAEVFPGPGGVSRAEIDQCLRGGLSRSKWPRRIVLRDSAALPGLEETTRQTLEVSS